MADGTIRIRMDRRPQIVPVIGDVLTSSGGLRWLVTSREMEVVPDKVNETLWVQVVELGIDLVDGTGQ